MTALFPGPGASGAQDRGARLRVWRRVTGCAVLFLVVVGLALVGSHVRLKANDPWRSPVLKDLKERLRAAPKDEEIKRQIRELDLQYRQRYFRILAFNDAGVWLLLGGLVVFVVGAGQWMAAWHGPPMPGARSDDRKAAPREVVWARGAVGAVAGVVTVVLAGVALAKGVGLPRDATGWRDLAEAWGGAAAEEKQGREAASRAEMRENWPRFLGAEGNGLAATNAVGRWDAASGEGVVWRVPVPLPGFGSPIVWGARVFLSGADRRQREVYCFDGRDGRLAWRQVVGKVPGGAAGELDIPEMTGYAPGTMATDGRRVYAMFPNGDVVGLTMEGQVVWAKSVGMPDNMYGHTSSLATWQDRVIVQLDQGEPEDDKSRLIALDGRTGEVVWQRGRSWGSSWSTPVAFEFNGRGQIVVLAVPWVMAYDAAEGQEIWRVELLHGEITPSPLFAAGLVLAVSPADRLVAIRPDGQGDVTKTHVVWSSDEGVPDVTSPVSSGELAFTLTTIGMLTCYDMKDGAKVWEKDLDTEFHSSPAVAGGQVYAFGQKGLAVVVAAGREYREAHRTTMPDSFHASPAVVGGRVYVRGLTNLWCLGEGSARVAGAVAREGVR